MSKQPEALRLVEWLNDLDVRSPANIVNAVSAAAELKRLHSVNADLLEALSKYVGIDETRGLDTGLTQSARSAIAKATGEA